MDKFFIGVDVGTGSARAGVFDRRGRLLAAAKHPIKMWREAGDVVEQSSDDIWAAVSLVVRQSVAAAGVKAETIAGIGFDATCSLVVLDPNGRPLTVSPSGDPARNVIVWMDHRAVDQAKRINATGHAVLRYVGGAISPEMETPKILWLKENLPATYHSAGHFIDLADYLTFHATRSLARSVCTVTCKWTYLAHEKRWDGDYFRTIGLNELAEEGFVRIGKEVVDAGTPLGRGLTPSAAEDFGLLPGTPVGTGLIDAHAGGIGSVGASDGDKEPDVLSRLAYISGTSACAMASTREPAFVPGVWGPYYSAMVPGLWLCEGGQSAAGAAIDHLVQLHPACPAAAAEAKAAGIGLLEHLERQVMALVPAASDAVTLTADLHVVPEFIGNRSPHADPDARGVIAGLGLDNTPEGLARLYVAGLCGLGYGCRQIVEALSRNGVPIGTLVMSGGASQSALVRQIMADATGIRVVLPDTEEPVLLGAAMLGAVASGACLTVADAMATMSRLGPSQRPAAGALRVVHTAKFKVFELLQEADRELRVLMAGVR
jgi:D-ribulokinase